jgi:hypothetical protein
MINVGIICDIEYTRSIFLSSYYYAIKNIFNNVKLIYNINDLENIELLFIGNDHFWPHRQIWENDNFINHCNLRDIKVFVFTTERIITPHHPWNIDIQKNIEKFKNLYQYVIDVEDSNKLNKKIMRGMISKVYEDKPPKITNKLNKCLFYGNIYKNTYTDRNDIISKINNIIQIDVIESNNSSWEEYINILSQYKYILSPLSLSNSFTFRFYEILLVGSIPIHQVLDNTLNYYPNESKYDDVIYFKNVDELSDKISNFKLENSYNKPWLEDFLLDILKENNIYE